MITAEERRKRWYEKHPEHLIEKQRREELASYKAVGLIADINDEIAVRKIKGHCRRNNISICKIYQTSELSVMFNEIVNGQIVVVNNHGDLGNGLECYDTYKNIIDRKCHLHIRGPVKVKTEQHKEKSSRDLAFNLSRNVYELLHNYESSDDEM